MSVRPGRVARLVPAPEIERHSLLPDDSPADVAARLDLVLREFARITLDWEP